MNRFLIKLSVYLAIIIAFAYLFDFIITKGLKKTEYDEFVVWNDIVNGEIDADLIISGSSRAYVHMNPLLMDPILGIKSYNLGSDGNTFPIQYQKFRMYVDHYGYPEYVVHSVDIFTLHEKKTVFRNFQFLPYWDDQELKNLLKEYRGFNPSDFYFPLARYVGRPRMILNGFLEFFEVYHKKDTLREKGFHAVDKEWDGSFERFKKKYPKGRTFKVDRKVLAEFEDYLVDCQRNKVNVVLVYTPEYIEGQKYTVNRDSIMATFESMSKKYAVPFLDYSNDSLSFNRQYFYNAQHLNSEGADLCSAKLANDLNYRKMMLSRKNPLIFLQNPFELFK